MGYSRPKLACAFAALATSPAAPVNADQFGPAPVYSTTVRGGYTVGQNATRVFFGSQTDNFPIELSWPGLAVRAYANWSYLTYEPGDDAEATITINGTTVVGALTAATDFDCDWGYDHVASYSADITSLVSAAGPGTFVIGSAIDEPATLSLGEGLTIVVAYEDGGPLQHLHIYLGGINSSGASPGTGFGRMNLTPVYAGGSAHFFVNAIDGQGTLEDDFFLGPNVLSGILTGGVAGNAFRGAEGPPGGESDVRYDRAEGNISPWLNLGSSEVVFQSVGPFGNHDAVGHTIGAVSYAAICPRDLDRDNVVGISDLSVVLAHFGQHDAVVYADGDVNDDGEVGIGDLAELLAGFGADCD